MDDRRLIERYLRGERDAHALVDEWLRMAAGPFRRRLSAEWEDLQQELRLEVLRLLRADRFRGESSLKTYVWRVACHTCLDALRRLRRVPLPLSPSPDDEPPEPPAEGPSPLESALLAERERRLLRLLEAQSPDCRELWRQVLAGLTYVEIARRTGVSEGALRVRAHRCRKRALEQAGGNAAPATHAQAAGRGGSRGLP